MFFMFENKITYLFNNTKCRDIINQSEDLKLFINSDKDSIEHKALAKSLLKLIDVKENITKNIKI